MLTTTPFRISSSDVRRLGIWIDEDGSEIEYVET